MNENMGIEQRAADEALRKLMLEIPEEADPTGVLHITVQWAIQLLVEGSGYTPEDIHELCSNALKNTRVMN